MVLCSTMYKYIHVQTVNQKQHLSLCRPRMNRLTFRHDNSYNVQTYYASIPPVIIIINVAVTMEQDFAPFILLTE